jgi:hypothetical protein
MRAAATFHDGCLRVIYESHGEQPGSVPRMIVLATETLSGFDTEVLGSTLHAGPNWPEVHSRPGRFWVDWIDGEDVMSWTRQRVDGGWESLRDETFSNVEERELFVRGRIRAQAIE